MFEKIVEIYGDVIQYRGDPRVSKWFLMSSPMVPITFSLVFIFIVKVLLPIYMKNRKPYDLKKVIMMYNLFQVIFSTYLFYENSREWINGKFNYLKCNRIDYSNSPNAQRMAIAFYLYYLSKYTEFLDTIFFVLRKKTSQVTFLHIYHHASTPIWSWCVTKFYPVGSLSIGAALNSFIHIIMYTYYLLAGLGPQYQKYLWWKKYLTSMQMMQFALVIVHLTLTMFSSDCDISKTFLICYNFNGLLLFMLFFNFYRQVYKKKKSQD